ncbi:MAG: flavin reductase family protein [Acidimicrobiales bacterium]|nr:flavin reductase family protein [Acidimicrobiales bacterium]
MADQLPLDPASFRQVLGYFPTGVTVITAHPAGEAPVGLAVGSFTSVSLEPPLVAFCPARTSGSWPRIQATGVFCVNVLAADQEHVCRVFAGKGDDKFAGLGWRPSPAGSPVLADALAWIDCAIDAVHEAGDHFIVVGRVTALAVERAERPLVFFRGGYGSVAS